MLRSKEMIQKAEMENQRHHKAMLQIKVDTVKEQARHKREIESLYRNYFISDAMEKTELEKIKAKFDELLPAISAFDYYSLPEILQFFEMEDFTFLREMKALEICGHSNFDVSIIYYTPTWR